MSLYGYVGGTTSAAHRNKIRSKLIIHHGGSPTMFTSNLAKPNGRSAFAKGGALYIGGTSLYDSSSATNQQPGHSKAVVFQQNKAQSGGAVFITASGEGFFGNTMFENNTADRHQQGGTNDGGNGGTSTTTNLDGNGGAVYFEGDNWRSQGALGVQTTTKYFFGPGTTFNGNKAPNGGGGAIYLSYLRGEGSANGFLFDTGIQFDEHNHAQAGHGIFWQFRGEGAAMRDRTTPNALTLFHKDLTEHCNQNDFHNGFVASSAVTVQVKQGGFPKRRGGSSGNPGMKYPNQYKDWYSSLVKGGVLSDWPEESSMKQKAMATSRLLSNGKMETKSGHTVKDHVTQERSQFQALDYYGNAALDRGTTYCSARSTDPSITVPTSNVFTSTAGTGLLSYQSFSMRGKIGATSTVTFRCGNPQSSLLKGEMGSVSFDVTISACDPGEELNGAQVCEWCKQNYYSLHGYKCLPCPTGGACKTRLGHSLPATYRGATRPAVAPGYWLYGAPTWLIQRTDYCWDIDEECTTVNTCQHGLCRKVKVLKNDSFVCEEGGSIASGDYWDADRIHHCVTKEYFYRCPMDDIACQGTINVTDDSYLPALPVCNSSKEDLGIHGPIFCQETCNEGYEGPKCKTCQENWFKTADHSCVTCSGDLDPAMTKVLYSIGLVCALVCMGLLIALYLREDSGSKIWNKLCFPCIQCTNKCSEEGRAKQITKRVTAVMPTTNAELNEVDAHDINSKAASNDRALKLRWEKFKIFLAWQQIFGQMKYNYNIPWPKEVATYMRLYAVFQLDIFSVLPLDCLYRTDFYFGLIFSFVLPCICLVLIAVLHAVGKITYTHKLNKLPRKCVKTGVLIQNTWMDQTQAQNTYKKLAKANLIEVFGAENVTDKMIQMELNESTTPMLPYSTPYAKGNQPSTVCRLQPEAFMATIKHNIKQFRYRVRKRIDHMAYVSKLWKMFFMLLLLAYPSVAMRCTRFFSCESIGPLKYLSIDSRTLCQDEKWNGMLVLACLSCVLYVVGTPVLFFFLVNHARNEGVAWKLKQCSMSPKLERRMLMEAQTDATYSFEFWNDPEKGETEVIRKTLRKKALVTYLRRLNLRAHANMDRFGFIYESYSEKVWWYEVIELLRKFALNAMICLLAPNEAAQCVIGLFISVVFLVFVMQVRPYELGTDNLLAFLAHLQLVLTMLCGILIQHDYPMIGVSTEPEPSERLRLSNLILSIVVIASHASVFVFFLGSLVEEMFFSRESDHRLRRAKLRERAIKASSQARRKLQNVRKKMKSSLFNVLGSHTNQGEGGEWGDFGTASEVVAEVKEKKKLVKKKTETWL